MDDEEDKVEPTAAPAKPAKSIKSVKPVKPSQPSKPSEPSQDEEAVEAAAVGKSAKRDATEVMRGIDSDDEQEDDGEPTSTLFVKNLNFETPEETLRNAFEGIGPLRYVCRALTTSKALKLPCLQVGDSSHQAQPTPA